MLFHAKNGRVPIDNTTMDYVSFGKGGNALILLPGLGDGLTTVKGMALPFALAYRAYARQYTVYIFSRKNDLPEQYSTRDMAADQAKAMEALGLTGAYVMGISQGGMIAQYLAIDYPWLVRKLILAVTLARSNETVRGVCNRWISMAKCGDYKSLAIDTVEKSYSEKYRKRYRFLYPILGYIGKPKDFRRFLIQADSCLHHDASAELGKISCPSLVIGGGRDHIAGNNSSRELAEAIRSSELFLYPKLGHAAYEEARDFPERVLGFLGK